MRIEVSSPIVKTPRLLQMSGIFDLPVEEVSRMVWDVDLPLHERAWNIGLIVGPSGAGKSTVARHLWPESMVSEFDWPENRSVLDGFPRHMSVKEIVELLSSVGFSSPPAWVRPFSVLSVGEQFRVQMSRILAENAELAVVDEFTSVVDRTVAQIGSAALARTIRERNQKFIALSCHEDIEEWLQPDWLYRPATNEFAWRLLQRRPPITLRIGRVDRSRWALYRQHHYLATQLNPATTCFEAWWGDRPVAFTGVLNFPHPRLGPTRREHRTVCLPDFQGVGIGNAMSDFMAKMCVGLQFGYMSQTSHPAMIRRRAASKEWAMFMAPTIGGQKFPIHTPGMRPKDWGKIAARTSTRMRASFRWIGPGMDPETAWKLWNGVTDGWAGVTDGYREPRRLPTPIDAQMEEMWGKVKAG